MIINKKMSTNAGHWILIIKPEDDLLEIFDSLGTKEEDVEHMKSLAARCQFNNTRFQSPNSKSCGLFCLYTAFWRISDIDLPYGEVLSELFSPDPEKNEQIVKDFEKEWL